jgi:hypothetical protein
MVLVSISLGRFGPSIWPDSLTLRHLGLPEVYNLSGAGG